MVSKAMLLVVALGLVVGAEAFFASDLRKGMEKKGIECYGDGDLNKILSCLNFDLIVSMLTAGDNCTALAIREKCTVLGKFVACFNKKQMSDKCLDSATQALHTLAGTEYCNYTTEILLDECFDGVLPVIYPEWTEWAAFQQCSVTCGAGLQQRTRTCVNKDAHNETRAGCTGKGRESEACPTNVCEEPGDDSMAIIIGAAVGGVVVMVVIGLVVTVCVLYRKKKKPAQPRPEPACNGTGEYHDVPPVWHPGTNSREELLKQEGWA